MTTAQIHERLVGGSDCSPGSPTSRLTNPAYKHACEPPFPSLTQAAPAHDPHHDGFLLALARIAARRMAQGAVAAGRAPSTARQGFSHDWEE